MLPSHKTVSTASPVAWERILTLREIKTLEKDLYGWEVEIQNGKGSSRGPSTEPGVRNRGETGSLSGNREVKGLCEEGKDPVGIKRVMQRGSLGRAQRCC